MHMNKAIYVVSKRSYLRAGYPIQQFRLDSLNSIKSLTG